MPGIGPAPKLWVRGGAGRGIVGVGKEGIGGVADDWVLAREAKAASCAGSKLNPAVGIEAGVCTAAV
jgi:hypothetical protein